MCFFHLQGLLGFIPPYFNGWMKTGQRTNLLHLSKYGQTPPICGSFSTEYPRKVSFVPLKSPTNYGIIQIDQEEMRMKQEEATLRTKQALATALKEKMLKKSFSKITVSELIEACNINRKTFYYHFEDIYALLKWTFEQEAIEVLKGFDLLVNTEEAINFVLDYIHDNQYFINCAYDSVGYSELKRFLYTDLLEIFQNTIENGAKKMGLTVSEDFMAFLADFYTEALAGMVLSVLQGITVYKREEIVKNVLLICNVSIPQVLIAYASNGMI